MKNKERQLTFAQGQAGVYRVASELILRGHVPYMPAVDAGVDLLAEGRIRIQVKSTFAVSNHWRYAEKRIYQFTLSSGQRIKKQKFVSCAARKFSEYCDFVILWAIEENRFWIIPAIVVDGRHTVTIGPTKQWRDLDVDRMRKMKADGYSYEAIARAIGINSTTIKRRLNKHSEPKQNYTNLHQYESRWDLIDSYLSTLREAETAASESTKSPMRETAAVAVTTAKEATHA